jgi:hypothetical protein
MRIVGTNAIGVQGDIHDNVHIYLSSEDPRAVVAFQLQADSRRNIYVDRTIEELDMIRPIRGNRASWTSRNSRRWAGLVS